MQQFPLNEIIDQYCRLNMSLGEIAKKHLTYPNRIRRLLKKNGVKLRGHSEAQKNNLKKGGFHPTKGKKRSEQERYNIGKALSEKWSKLTEEDIKDKTHAMMEGMKKVREKKGDNIQKKAQKKLKETSEKGSKIEHFLVEKLKKDGYNVEHHVKMLIDNENMHFDIAVHLNPTIVIEVDGPTHHRPVFGQERLDKQIEADLRKNMLVMSNKMHIIRVKADYTNISLYKKMEMYKDLIDALKQLKEDKEYKIVHIDKLGG